jgi:hypothetical protein
MTAKRPVRCFEVPIVFLLLLGWVISQHAKLNAAVSVPGMELMEKKGSALAGS